MPGVCLSVSLLASLRKTTEWISVKLFSQMYLLTGKMELMERTLLLKSVICQGRYMMPGVCLSAVCLSVCLLATLHKN